MALDKPLRQHGLNSERLLMPQKAGAFLIIPGKKFETMGQASALFSGVQQGHIKAGQPATELLEGFAEGQTLRQVGQQMLDRLAKRTRGRRLLQGGERLRQ